MFENAVKTNGTQSWKFATITVRVYVDNDELEALLEAGKDEDGEPVTSRDDAFDRLARPKISGMFPTDEPCKFYDVEL